MKAQAVLPDLFTPRRLPVADTSREAFDRIRPTLTERERMVFLKLCDYCEATKYPDATGGELADRFAPMSILSIRPRLTGLYAKGFVTKGPIRFSRVSEEFGRCRGYAPAVSRDAWSVADERDH